MSTLSSAELIDEGWAAVALFSADPAEVHGLMPLSDNDDVPGTSSAVIQGRLKNSEQLSKLDKCYLLQYDVLNLIKCHLSANRDNPDKSRQLQ